MSNLTLRECSQQLADKIHIVIMSSLAEGKAPIDWKRADIVPIFKRGNKKDPLNYRPVLWPRYTLVLHRTCADRSILL